MNSMRCRPGVTKASVIATGLVLWVLVGSAVAEPLRLAEEGTVVARDADRGWLVVEHGGESRELFIDIGARLFDDRGETVAFEQLRPGDYIFYEFEITETTWFVTEIRFSSRPTIATTGDEP
jgi:hypothetical protein